MEKEIISPFHIITKQCKNSDFLFGVEGVSCRKIMAFIQSMKCFQRLPGCHQDGNSVSFQNQCCIYHIFPPFFDWCSLVDGNSTMFCNSFLITSSQPLYRLHYAICIPGTSLVVQWLRLQAPKRRGPSSIPHQGIRSQMLQLKILQLRYIYIYIPIH